MKNLKYCFLLALASTLFIISSCNKEEFIDEKTQGLNLNIKADVLRSPVSVQFLDAAGNETPSNINVEVLGENKDRIYSLVGERNLVVNEGFIDFAVDKNDEISVTNPLEFSVKVTAPGYVPTVKTYIIRDINELTKDRIFLVDRAAPPVGVSTVTGNISASIEGTSTAVSVQTPSSETVQETASILFPSGTQFYAADGTQLVGGITAQTTYFDNRSQSSLDAFPGGFTAINVVDENDNPLDPVQFETAGFLAINLSAGGEEVRQFSQPIPVSMTLNEETINPETGSPIAIGDEIPYWSLDEDTGNWKREGNALVSEVNGKLQADFEITHLSYYNLDWYYDLCFESTITIQSNIPKIHEGNGRWSHYGYAYDYYFGEVINAATGQTISYLYNLGPLYDGQELSFWLAPQMEVYLRISSGSWGCKEVIYESEPFNFCTVGTLDVQLPSPAQKVNVNAEISGVCTGTGRSIEIRPFVYIYYREAGCAYYDWLGYFFNGKFSSRKLELGKTYDFAIYYNYDQYKFTDVPIESTVLNYNGQVVNIEIDQNNEVNFTMTEIPIPDEICNSFGF